MKQKRILALFLALIVTIGGIWADVPQVYATMSGKGVVGYILTEDDYQKFRNGANPNLGVSVEADTLEDLWEELAGMQDAAGYYLIQPEENNGDGTYVQSAALNIPASVTVTSSGAVAVKGVVLAGNYQTSGITVASGVETILTGSSFENTAGDNFVLSGAGTVVFGGEYGGVNVKDTLCGDAGSAALQVKFRGADALVSRGLDATKWGSVTFEGDQGDDSMIAVDGAATFGTVNVEKGYAGIMVKYDESKLPTFTKTPGTFDKINGSNTLSGMSEKKLFIKYFTTTTAFEEVDFGNEPTASFTTGQKLVNYSGVDGALWACKLCCDRNGGGDKGYIDEKGCFNSGDDDKGIRLSDFGNQANIESYQKNGNNQPDPDTLGFFQTMDGAITAMKQDAANGGSGYYWIWVGDNELSAPVAIDVSGTAGIKSFGVGILNEITGTDSNGDPIFGDQYPFPGFSTVKLAASQEFCVFNEIVNKTGSVTGGTLNIKQDSNLKIGTVDVKELKLNNNADATIGTLKADKITISKQYGENSQIRIVDKLDAGSVVIDSSDNGMIILYKNSTARFGGISGHGLHVYMENDATGKLPQVTIDGNINLDKDANGEIMSEVAFRIYNWKDLGEDAAVDRYALDYDLPLWNKVDSTWNFAKESDITDSVLLTVTAGNTILDKAVEVWLANQPGENWKVAWYETADVRQTSVSGGTAVYGKYSILDGNYAKVGSGHLSKYILIKSSTTSSGGGSSSGGWSGGGSSGGGGGSSSGGSSSSTTPTTTTETKPDGTKVEVTTETTTDGTKVETTVETKPDGSVTESVSETAADGTKTETVTETATDGSKTESVTETKPDGSKIETVTETKPDGSVNETKTETAADGSTVESVKETAADGSSVENIVEKNESGEVVKTTETVTATDGSAVKTERESTTNILGTDVAVTLTTRTNSTGSVTSVTRTSEIVDSVTGVSMVVTAVMNGSGTIKRAKAVITLTVGNAGKASLKLAPPAADVSALRKLAEGVSATISKDMLAEIVEAAGTDAVAVTVIVRDEDSNVKYRLKVNADTLTPGNKLYIYKLNTNTGNYTMVNAKTYKVGSGGEVTVSMSTKATYELVDAAKAKIINTAIKATIVPKYESRTIKLGRTVAFSLKKGVRKSCIKSISYTSSKPSVATVDQDGWITATGRGTAIIKAKVTLKNGKVKNIKMKIVVE